MKIVKTPLKAFTPYTITLVIAEEKEEALLKELVKYRYTIANEAFPWLPIEQKNTVNLFHCLGKALAS